MTYPASAVDSLQNDTKLLSAAVPPTALSNDHHATVNCIDGRSFIHDWTADPRVAPILNRIAKNGSAQTFFEAPSDSSWGNKTYHQCSGADVDALDAIYNEYANAAWVAYELWETTAVLENGHYADYDKSPFSLFKALPRVEDMARYVQSEWIDYRGNDRAGYFAKMDAVYPMQVAA